MTHRTRYDDDFKTLVSNALKRGEQPLKIAEFLRCHRSTNGIFSGVLAFYLYLVEFESRAVGAGVAEVLPKHVIS